VGPLVKLQTRCVVPRSTVQRHWRLRVRPRECCSSTGLVSGLADQLVVLEQCLIVMRETFCREH